MFFKPKQFDKNLSSSLITPIYLSVLLLATGFILWGYEYPLEVVLTSDNHSNIKFILQFLT